ncbi:VWA domain-containing protein [bacterium]|nr:MAG: VWA domain-containing protein [bacterium]
MIEGQLAKVGIAGVLIGAVWAMSLGVERLGGERLIDQQAKEGALVPEVPEIVEPIPVGIKHTALVTLNIPKVPSIDPGSIKITTPGYTIDDTKIRPVLEYKKAANPKPRSILVLLDNSNSMKIAANGNPPSDPNYQRLEACRNLLASLSPGTDTVALATFPCRNSTEDWSHRNNTTRPFELVTPWTTPVEAADLVESLRAEENGSTPLYRAVEQASQALASRGGDAQRILVLLSDGQDTDFLPDGEQRAIEAIKTSKAETYAIGLGGGADMEGLKELTPNVLKADDAQALNRAFRQILLQMSREVVQIDMDVMVGRVGDPIPKGQPVEITFRSGGKLYKAIGKAQG